MKRRIEVTAEGVRISATVSTNGWQLTRVEVERIRDALADRLQAAASQLPYIGVAVNRVKVR